MVYETTQWLGWAFCEFAFRWFDVFDGAIPGDEDYRWYHRVPCFIGDKAYSVGCWFYNVGGDK